MLLPILAPTALMLGVHPYIHMVGATLAASCAFMLPVATPPNAVVFGSNYLKISDMVRVGILMNLISIIIIFLMETSIRMLKFSNKSNFSIIIYIINNFRIGSTYSLILEAFKLGS